MSAQPQSISRPRVLFVDDEPRVLNSMRVMFRREYELSLANSGADAIDILAGSDIDVIVCDQRMPGMSGVEVLSRAKAISPNTIRILLTGYADLDAVEGSINEGEVFRFLTKPCAPDELKETLRLAANLALEECVDEAPRTAPQPVKRATPAVSPATAVPKAAFPRRQLAASPDSSMDAGMLVFSTDDSISAIAAEATRGLIRVYRARSIAKVIDVLTEHRPGVLLTDISQDKVTIQTMTARLKQHVPELVTIAIAEQRDVLDMVWLINHGQIFRFLRKPLTPGRCAVSLKAALQHHRKLLDSPQLVKRHTVRKTTEDASGHGLLARLAFLRNLWSR